MTTLDTLVTIHCTLHVLYPLSTVWRKRALNLQVNLNEDDVLDFVSISSLPDFLHGPCMAEESQSAPYHGWGYDL